MDAKLQQQVPKKAQTNKPNLTGIPTQMKLDFERRSGLSFDDVRVHYNSDKPAQLQALAYTQGTQVFVGPGQGKYLPHELSHVVQQKMGMVQPTAFIGGMPINRSPMLEKMADNPYGVLSYVQGLTKQENTDVIQCAGTVELSLVPQKDLNTKYSADQVLVDTLKILDRYATGLPNSSQGDHTIADVLIKKYQRDSIIGCPISSACDFYFENSKRIMKLATWADHIEYDRDKEFRDGKKYRKGEHILNYRGRSGRAYKFAKGAGDYANTIKTKDATLSVWNMKLKAIINKFNHAYALSPFSTLGVGTGGHGEAGGIKNLKTAKHNPLTITNLISLIDFGSVRESNYPKEYKVTPDFISQVEKIHPYITPVSSSNPIANENMDRFNAYLTDIETDKTSYCHPAVFLFVKILNEELFDRGPALTPRHDKRHAKKKKIDKKINIALKKLPALKDKEKLDPLELNPRF